MPTAANIYYYEHRGENHHKLPIVLIHGAGGTHLHWPASLRRLSDHRIYALDLPGHGKSKGRGYQKIEAYAESILTWMDAIHLHNAVFIGHSMGGGICQILGLQHPERVLGLGLTSTGARLRVDSAILEKTSQPAAFPEAVATIIQWAFSSQADERLVELAAKRMNEIRPSVLHGDFIACNAFDVMEDISKIRAPTLVLCGEDDQLTPLRYSQYLADHIPKAEIQTIPEAGHMVMLEKPDEVAEAWSGFLAQIPYRL